MCPEKAQCVDVSGCRGGGGLPQEPGGQAGAAAVHDYTPGAVQGAGQTPSLKGGQARLGVPFRVWWKPKQAVVTEREESQGSRPHYSFFQYLTVHLSCWVSLLGLS